MTQPELKPCQCGSKAGYAATINAKVFVNCSKCGLGGPVEAWNNRPAEQTLIEALQGMMPYEPMELNGAEICPIPVDKVMAGYEALEKAGVK